MDFWRASIGIWKKEEKRRNNDSLCYILILGERQRAYLESKYLKTNMTGTRLRYGDVVKHTFALHYSRCFCKKKK